MLARAATMFLYHPGILEPTRNISRAYRQAWVTRQVAPRLRLPFVNFYICAALRTEAWDEYLDRDLAGIIGR